MVTELVGPWYDVVFTVATAVVLVLFVWAIARWFRDRDPFTGSVLWFVVIVLLPVFGPSAYLVISQRRVSEA